MARYPFRLGPDLATLEDLSMQLFCGMPRTGKSILGLQRLLDAPPAPACGDIMEQRAARRSVQGGPRTTPGMASQAVTEMAGAVRTDRP